MARLTTPEKSPPARPSTDFGPKVKAHTRYYTSAGQMVPGATTVLNVLNKPALVKWANNLGLAGVDSNKFVDEAALVGTLAHHLVECELAGREPQLRDFTPAQLELARIAHGTFQTWAAAHTLEPQLLEAPLVSDVWRYGGTVDFYGFVDGRPELLDFKTSSGIYPEHIYQVASYWRLLTEAGHPVSGVRILRIGRDGSGIEEHVISGQQVLHGWKIFRCCLEIHQLKKEMKG